MRSTLEFFQLGRKYSAWDGSKKKFSSVLRVLFYVFQHDTMAADHNQFYQLLDSLLSIDNDVRPEAEVSNYNI